MKKKQREKDQSKPKKKNKQQGNLNLLLVVSVLFVVLLRKQSGLSSSQIRVCANEAVGLVKYRVE